MDEEPTFEENMLFYIGLFIAVGVVLVQFATAVGMLVLIYKIFTS